MNRLIPTFRLLAAFVSAVAMLCAVATVEVQAGFHHHHRRGCCCSACHHRGWHRGSHGSSGGSSGGSHGSAGAAPKAAAAPAPAPAPAKVAGGVMADAAMMVVQLPENARLFINGQATSLSGAVRHFATSGLADDKEYAYDLKVVIDDAGKSVEQIRTVWLEAGKQQVVSFAAPHRDVAPAVAAATTPTTSLILHVPAEAKVWVAGRLSSGSGEVRRFSTTALAAGQSVEDYEVRVVCTVDGREQEAVRRITLTGGRDAELSVDPSAKADASATASLR